MDSFAGDRWVQLPSKGPDHSGTQWRTIAAASPLVHADVGLCPRVLTILVGTRAAYQPGLSLTLDRDTPFPEFEVMWETRQALLQAEIE